MKRRKQGTEDIIQLKWNSGTMVVIRSGPHESDGRKRVRRPSISIYYFLLKNFDPFVGTPEEQKHRWVVEYVWEVWITESGPALQEHSANGNDRVRAEQEMRAALEATVSARALPDDRPLTTADFTAAIDDALSSLRRISGTGA